MRLSKEAYYLDIAKACAMRSPCLRRKFGAVIVNDDRIISTGYNGPPRGVGHCKVCPREEAGCKRGEGYDLCVAVHAEANAIINASANDMLGATMYISGVDANGNKLNGTPCHMCKRLIINSKIGKVIPDTCNTEDGYDIIVPSFNWTHSSVLARKP